MKVLLECPLNSVTANDMVPTINTALLTNLLNAKSLADLDIAIYNPAHKDLAFLFGDRTLAEAKRQQLSNEYIRYDEAPIDET